MFGKKKITASNGKEITATKWIVVRAGMRRSGGSILEVTAKMNRTESNTRQHIQQCKSMYGFDYRIDGDRFWIFAP